MIWKALFSTLGLGSFIFILQGYGFARLGQDILGLGWWSIPLALSFLPVAVCYAIAWHLITPGWPLSRFHTLVNYSIVTVAWNNLSPFVKALGEPVRLVLLERHMPRRDAARSVVLYNLVHTMGTLLSFFFGSILLLIIFPVSEGLKTGFLVLIGVSPALAGLLYFLPVLAKSRRRRSGPRSRFHVAAFWLRWGITKAGTFSRRYRTRFWLAVGIEIVARFIEGLTFYIAFRAIGHAVPAFTCALLDVGRALIDNIFFFIPYQVGSREGGLLLLANHAVQVDSAAAVSAAVFYRLVEILWMGIGYILWMRAGSSAKPTR